MKTTNKSKNSISGAKAPINTKRSSKIDQLMSVLPFCFNTKPVVAVMRLEGVIGKAGSMKSGLTISSLNKLIEKIKSIFLYSNIINFLIFIWI